MIESIISSLVVITAVILGDYLSSLVFGTLKGAKEVIVEILLFLVLLNLLLGSVLVPDDLFVKLFVYFLVSFVSIISSKSIVFLVFRKVPDKLGFKKNPFNSSAIKLAYLLNKKFTKEQVISYFKNSGFSSSFLNHLDKTLKE